MKLRFAIPGLLAAMACSGEAVALGDIRHAPLRTAIERLEPAAQARALATLARRPRVLAQAADMQVSSSGVFRYVNCRRPPPRAQARAKANAAAPPIMLAPVPINTPPALSSLPGATRTIYLDFNGHTVSGTQWNTDYSVTAWDARPFDIDNDPASFSDTEQGIIHLVWQRVSEDFRPFNVNVTTVEPTSFTSNTARALITRSTDSNGEECPESASASGLAYLGVFGQSDFVARYSPAWVYHDILNDNEADIADTVSHEIGHNLDLSHDGAGGDAYYGGHGPAAYDWAPIMGSGWDMEVTQWSRGEYDNATNTEDDLAIITSYLTLRTDDHGNAIASATAFPLSVGATERTANLTGLITSTTDADYFAFRSRAGTVNLSISALRAVAHLGVTPSTIGNNLDVQADILNSAGTLVGSLTSNPTDNPDASLSGSLPAPGTYYLRVRNAGNRTVDDGFSTYASLGTYTVTGSVPLDVSGTLAFTVSSASLAEGNTNGQIVLTVTRTVSTSGTASVDFTITALPTADPTSPDFLSGATPITPGSPFSGTVSFANGEASQTIIITRVGDTIEEPSEGFIAALSNPSDGASLGGRTTCVITLLNDDGPSAAVAADAAAMIKPNGTGDSGPCGIGGASSALGLAAFALFLRRRRR